MGRVSPTTAGCSCGGKQGPFPEGRKSGILGRLTSAGHIVFSVGEHVVATLRREPETGKREVCENQPN